MNGSNNLFWELAILAMICVGVLAKLFEKRD
jgi:hypothetical protein